jgi:hypothetical protein
VLESVDNKKRPTEGIYKGIMLACWANKNIHRIRKLGYQPKNIAAKFSIRKLQLFYNLCCNKPINISTLVFWFFQIFVFSHKLSTQTKNWEKLFQSFANMWKIILFMWNKNKFLCCFFVVFLFSYNFYNNKNSSSVLSEEMNDKIIILSNNFLIISVEA